MMMVSSCFCRAGILDPAQRLDRAADRRQRVLDLVRHIGGEASRSHPSVRTAPAPNPKARSPAFPPRRAAPAAAPARRPHVRGPRASPPPHRPAAGSAGRSSSDRYQDSSTVSPSARPNSARMEMRTTNRLVSTSRASRVSRMMPTVWRSRSTGSATVTSSRLSLVRRM